LHLASGIFGLTAESGLKSHARAAPRQRNDALAALEERNPEGVVRRPVENLKVGILQSFVVEVDE
jgi:hypothetical protein